jgi:hypothetical protein
MTGTWPIVRPVSADRLAAARLQLHHAAQIVSSVGISFLPPVSDDSHTGFTWRSAGGLLVGEGPTATQRFGLVARHCTLVQCDVEGKVAAEFRMAGQSVASAYDWLRAQLRGLGLDPGRLTRTKHYEIPAHPVSAGAPFDTSDAEAFDTLSRWYEVGARLAALSLADSGTPGEVRIWPHHFDIAALTVLAGEPRRTVGIGMTPGDEWYAEPYVYVGPYPYPSYRALPPLPDGGTWHTTSWFGAVLTASALSSTPAAGQERSAVSFAREARLRCVELLGGAPAGRQ